MDKEFFLSGAGVPPPLHFEAPSPFPASLWAATELNPFPADDHRFHFQRAWEKSTEQFPRLESALDSLVSSAPNSGFPRDGSAIRELIGKLGNISTTAFASNAQPPPSTSTAAAMEIPMPPPRSSSSPRPYAAAIDAGVCAEFDSPPVAGNLNPIAAEFPGDPGFAERAAKFSRFGSRSFNGPDSAESAQRSNALLCRVLSTPARKPAGLHSRRDGAHDGKVNRSERASPPSHAELGNASQGDSSVSEQFPSGNSNPRKRKAACRNKPKEISSPKPPKVNGESEDDAKSKRCRAGEGNRNCSVKAEEDAKADGSPKPPEPPKDYIHVRARRGQATDSHSLAERVRREKISERMKLLQDLVPGCNKVTGKALMLDEIINYVRSLQRQVEFLSMRLANVDFRPDIGNMQSILQKDMLQTSGALTHTVYDPQLHSFGQQNPPLPTSTNNFPSGKQCSVGLLDDTLGANQLHSIHEFIDQAVPQLPTICQDDLQSIVQMGFGSNLNRGTETMNYRPYSE